MSESLYSQPETAEAIASKPVPVLPKMQAGSANNGKFQFLVGGVALGIVIGAGGFVLVDRAFPLESTSDSQVQISTSTAQQLLEAVKYQDGTYMADATYAVPAADNKVHTLRVTIQVQDAEIVAVDIIEIDDEQAQVANSYLENFVTELSKLVVGKPLDDIAQMDLVSGSTLTADAFKVAVADVQVEAEKIAQAIKKYKDGEYYVESTFELPEYDLSHTLGVTVTVDAGLITDVQVIEVDENSEEVENEHIVEFDEALEELIVGKTIDDSLNLDTVSGSSYTTIGFNEAMVMVRDDALKN